MSLQFPVDVFVIQLFQIVAEPFVPDGKQPEERRFPGALAADEEEHQFEFASGLKRPVDRAKHENPQAFLVEVGNIRTEKMMKSKPDARHSVPDKTGEIVTNRVILVFVRDDTDGFGDFLFAGQMITILQAQLDVFLVCIGQHIP